MIGLVDYDLCKSKKTSILIPNLEIMKLATYYKFEKNKFCRLLTLEEQELDSYDKIYFFSELSNYPQIPEHYLRAKNISYGGTAFTNGVYIPFEEEIIDYTIPKPFIYKEFLKQKYNDGIKAKVISHVLDDTYYRCYAGTEKLPIPSILSRKRVFLYDKDFFYGDWEDIIDEISSRRPASIIRIHPIVCKKLGQYFKIRQKEKLSRANEIILDLNIPLSDVDYMLKKYKNIFLSDITSTSNVFITLGETFSTSFQYYKDLIYKLNLLYAFWSRNIPLKVKYIEPILGTHDILAPLSKSIERWTRNLTITGSKTINDRIIFKSKKDKSPAQEARDLLLKFHPGANDLFNQTYKQLVEKRYWRL